MSFLRNLSSGYCLPGTGAGIVPLLALMVCLGCGCGKSQVDQALDSDANGFLCLDCKAKFYTDREVFANHCPACRKANIEMVVGFNCPADKHVTHAPRGKGFVACEQCGKVTSALSIPREAELKTWGAEHRTSAEVGVN